jgi:phosphatidate cytidylyltransferase
MNKELKKRLITSIILIAIVLNCLFINNFFWLLLLSIVSCICWLEFINLAKKIWKRKTIIILPIILSFFFLSFFIFTAYGYRVEKGSAGILFVLGICIFSDIGGYIIGKSIGGKKLTKISPNKTISGSFGSFLFSLFPLGILMVFNFKENFSEKIILFCLLVSLTCQLGDLIISYFKRLAKVKDTGKILPGHGGMLDRIDGVIFAIPFTVITQPLAF